MARKAEWALVGLALGLGVALWYARGAPTLPAAGDEVLAPITLITADRHDLSCASPGAVGPYRCAFSAPDAAHAPAPPPALTLVPYKTTADQLYLIPGLFTAPPLRARYRKEPPRGKGRRQLRRFTAHCTLRLVERIPAPFVRWSPRGKWHKARPCWVATVRSCETDGR